jgi:hypothetical protein
MPHRGALDGGDGSPPARWARCWQTSDPGARFASPRVDWPQIEGRGSLRRVAAADQWWHGRGHSNSGKDWHGAGQRVARVASLGPSGGTGMVGWLGVRAESGGRRWLPGGGREDSSFGEQAARLGLVLGVQAQVVQEEGLGVLGALELCGTESSLGRHRWRTTAAWCSRA